MPRWPTERFEDCCAVKWDSLHRGVDPHRLRRKPRGGGPESWTAQRFFSTAPEQARRTPSVADPSRHEPGRSTSRRGRTSTATPRRGPLSISESLRSSTTAPSGFISWSQPHETLPRAYARRERVRERVDREAERAVRAGEIVRQLAALAEELAVMGKDPHSVTLRTTAIAAAQDAAQAARSAAGVVGHHAALAARIQHRADLVGARVAALVDRASRDIAQTTAEFVRSNTPERCHPMTRAITSDAEQARRTGGMIALYPSPESARKLAVPGGEPIDDLHLTMVYFGEDVSELSSLGAQSVLDDIAMWTQIVTARAFAHATFNPDAEVGDPCAVYLIGNAPELADIQREVFVETSARYNLKEQHLPWVPHVTAGYGLEAADLGYTGEIEFDRLVLNWMGQTYTYPLG